MNLTDFRTLGRTGLRVSPLALGTMTFGDASWGADDDTSNEILSRYLDAGGNLVDTANAYMGGRAEEVLGNYLGKRPGLRDRLVISTKFALSMDPADPNNGGTGRKAIRRRVEESLGRLGTDYLDLYWQHNWDPHTPLEETISTLDDLVREGKVRYIGLSDTPAWAVARMATLAQWRGWSPVAAIQVEYNLLERTSEGELFGVARELGLGVMPWSPLANGMLTGKYTRDNQSPDGAGRGMFVGRHLHERTFQVLDALGRIADSLGTTRAAAALAWVRQQPLVSATILGARSLRQLEANLASLDVDLAPEHLAELDRLTAPDLNFPATFLKTIGFPAQQGNTTINGVRASA
ncbi:aryl-alcohol dehydrogenase-like predicted oxidoreductase [Asanoa ferruginea]|uniref:Aryl-alcohol dehydrogenase-like predicted oxidoreductase n=1 Tax=Asanoa ferruginea TaxID=53367 RepID=A0A3D9ZZY2_9ACTN|nr:aldo/keto reductase [Asanoa ferruginea]REF99430.1 aryl-alcohol dehydrogenase-like predicted oxidoreductase [Asanoa ferruginea]GIF46035.1 aldo/keto reductase [Asanoa ferruginea]